MNPQPEHDIRLSLADLREEAAALERRLSELTRLSQGRERGRSPHRPRPARAPFAGALWTAGPADAGATAGYGGPPDGAAGNAAPADDRAVADDWAVADDRAVADDWAVADDRAVAWEAAGDWADDDGTDLDEAPGYGDTWYGSADDDGAEPGYYGHTPITLDDLHDHRDLDGSPDPAVNGRSGGRVHGHDGRREPVADGARYPAFAADDDPEAGYGPVDEGGHAAAADADPDDENADLPWAEELDATEQRTEILVGQGRPSAYERGWSRGRKLAVAAGAALALVIVIIFVATLAGGSASWPPSVAVMQSEAARACQNPDVKSEPGQVNFACAKSSRQILWVFALLTSGGNPGFADPRTGRMGLEPITRAQGGALAWSLNLHHPYDPANPVDSLQVAARAINNIVGGATVTSTAGNPVVQPGLESDAANCLRYTGSAALTTRSGFPAVCAQPVTAPAGQAALVADVFQRWVVNASPAVAQDAAVLFANARNPGDPQVQAILKRSQAGHR